jgi:hypothetical protein
MSGVAIGISAAAAAVSAGIAGVSAVQQNQAQKKSLGMQEKAQNEAMASARSQQRESQMRESMANRRQPDVAGIMQAAQKEGAAGTMLTGPMGANAAATSLGKTSLLGG